jgi:hypothetical protein
MRSGDPPTLNLPNQNKNSSLRKLQMLYSGIYYILAALATHVSAQQITFSGWTAIPTSSSDLLTHPSNICPKGYWNVPEIATKLNVSKICFWVRPKRLLPSADREKCLHGYKESLEEAGVCDADYEYLDPFLVSVF